MPHFDIVKINKPDQTFRVSKIQADFDVKLEHSNEHFVGEIILPEKWNIGVIVGPSGTGKTTIAQELFGDKNKEITNSILIDGHHSIEEQYLVTGLNTADIFFNRIQN